MDLQVVGVGFPRTGTTSLKAALGRLLGGPCYHMVEMRQSADDGQLWDLALDGDTAALDQVLAGYVATTDWPASLFWRELMDQNRNALVLLSHRGRAETWWKSADNTVWAAMRNPDNDEQFNNFHAKMRAKAGLGDDWDEPTAMMRHYNSLIAEVVATVPSERLLMWQPSDGWDSICAALGIDAPSEDFFHLNESNDFRTRHGLDDG